MSSKLTIDVIQLEGWRPLLTKGARIRFSSGVLYNFKIRRLLLCVGAPTGFVFDELRRSHVLCFFRQHYHVTAYIVRTIRRPCVVKVSLSKQNIYVMEGRPLPHGCGHHC